MNNIAKFLLSTLIAACLFSSVYSQTSIAYLILHKINDKIISENAIGEKTVVFGIAGLSNKQEVDALINTMKTLRGVVSVTVEETSTDGTWKTSVVFYKYASKMYFKDFFKWCGIQNIVVDNVTYNTENFEMVE